MAHRSVTDDEIALIKAMLARGMRNKDIQFFFNRPSRSVNSGRITGIANGSYSDSQQIPAASNEELDAFLATHAASDEMPYVDAPPQPEDSAPLADTVVRKMFGKDKAGIWRLTEGETDHTECKENFGLKHSGAWMRAMAALANNRGGYIFFGISDKDDEGNGTHRVVGMTSDDFIKIDPAEIARRVKAAFSPTPQFQKSVIEIDGKKVGIIYVNQHPSRPVIATKSDDKINEGDIFYRYPGTSSRITYSDLRALLDARDAQVRADILPMVERLLSLGPKRAMIADLVEGELTDGKRAIQIDESLLDKITFIKEGEFTEKSGAPTLRLIGNVESVDAVGNTVVKKGIVAERDLLRDFLTGQHHAAPIDYLNRALEVTHRGWFPIRHFANAAKMSPGELLSFIAASTATPPHKRLFRERLSKRDAAHVVAKGPSREVLDRLLAGNELNPSTITEAREVALAIQGISRPLALNLDILKGLLLTCLDICAQNKDTQTRTAVRKAIARLDELIYA